MYKATGVILEKFALKTGTSEAGNEWKRQEFLFEIPDKKYPKTIKLICFNAKVDMLSLINIGETVNITFDINAKKFKEQWYNDISLMSIGKEQQTASASEQDTSEENAIVKEETSDDLPY